VGSKTASVDKSSDGLPALVIATGVIELMLPQPSVGLVISPNTPQDVEGIEHVCEYSGRCERVSRVDRLVQAIQVQS